MTFRKEQIGDCRMRRPHWDETHPNNRSHNPRAVELPQEPQIEAYRAKAAYRTLRGGGPQERTVRASQANSATRRKTPVSLPSLSFLKD